MCQEKNKFIFCTCDGARETLNHSTELAHYTWTLTNYLGQKESLVRGKIVLPKRDLGNGLTIEYIVNQLNNNESFDFENERLNSSIST